MENPNKWEVSIKRTTNMQEPLKTSSKTKTKQGTRLARATSLTLLGVGAAALITSVIYVSQILAFIGLSLVFFGALLLYIQPEEYTKKTLLDATALTSLEALSQIMQELNYKGKAIYLPPKYLRDPEANKIYIPKQKDAKLPTPELILKHESQLFIKNPQGILLTPLGAEMTKLFEKTLGTSFTKVDPEYLQQNLPKVFIEDLEIAEDLEIETKSRKAAKKITGSVSLIGTTSDTIHVKITNPILQDMWKEDRKHYHIYSKIGCPICSAIACALTKATGKPITIETLQPSEDGKIIEATYRMLETTEPQEQVGKALSEISEAIGRHSSRLSKVASLVPIAFGSTILAWVGWLTWHDVTTWGKDLTVILFGSRTGEPIDLTIGMRVIHYFIIGLTLLLTGIVIHLRRRKSSTLDQHKRPLT